MPVLTSVKTMKRYGNERVNGVNGFAYLDSSAAVNACEYNGNLVSISGTPETSVPIKGTGSLTGIVERVSANAKYGEKISFSVSKMAGTAFTFTATPTTDLTTLVYWCNDGDLLEFSWSLNIPIEIAYCSTTQYKYGRPTGNITVYASKAFGEGGEYATFPTLAPTEAGLYFIAYGLDTTVGATFGNPGVPGAGIEQIEPAMAISEEGTEYDPDNGERFFMAKEIISCSGFPHSAFRTLPNGGAVLANT